MNVRQLKELLGEFDERMEIEIATQPNHPDEWYEIADLEPGTNFKGHPIVIINTD